MMMMVKIIIIIYEENHKHSMSPEQNRTEQKDVYHFLNTMMFPISTM